jgi:hypothetical protein
LEHDRQTPTLVQAGKHQCPGPAVEHLHLHRLQEAEELHMCRDAKVARDADQPCVLFIQVTRAHQRHRHALGAKLRKGLQ